MWYMTVCFAFAFVSCSHIHITATAVTPFSHSIVIHSFIHFPFWLDCCYYLYKNIIYLSIGYHVSPSLYLPTWKLQKISLILKDLMGSWKNDMMINIKQRRLWWRYWWCGCCSWPCRWILLTTLLDRAGPILCFLFISFVQSVREETLRMPPCENHTYEHKCRYS